MHITEGNRGGWSGPKNKDGYWAWWSYHEMCTWSKWKPCYPEMYWMCSRRFYSVYNINILWSCCSIINPPLWLQSHTGMHLGSAHMCKCSVPSCVNEIYSFLFSIQRVLEHCADPKTQQIVMDEILQSVCMLAQDQYGNYVVQVQCCFPTFLNLHFDFQSWVAIIFLPFWFLYCNKHLQYLCSVVYTLLCMPCYFFVDCF